MTRVLRLLAVGAVCGAAWGVAARVWMRIISTDPVFTWVATLFIIAVAAMPGLGMGVVLAARGRVRAVGIVTVLPLGVGPGMIMLPTIVLGAVALARRDARPALRAVLAGLAVLPALLVIGPGLVADLSVPRAAIGFVLYLGLMLWMSAMVAVSFRPARRKPGTTTVPDRRSALVG